MPNVVRSISLTSLAGLFCLPFLLPVHTAPLPAFYAEWLAACLGVLASVALLYCRNHECSIPHVAVVPIGLTILLSVELALNENTSPSGGLLATLYLLLSLTVMLTASAQAHIIGRRKLIIVLLWATLVGGAISSSIAIIQHWNINTPFAALVVAKLSEREYGNIAQSNHLATQVALAVISLGVLLSGRHLSWRTAGAIAPLLLLGLSLTGSRSAWLYLTASLALTVAYRYQLKSESSDRFVRYALGAVAMFIVMQFLLALPGLTAHFDPTPGAEIVTASTRLSVTPPQLEVRPTLWLNALRMFLDHPLLGVGYQGYSWNFFLLEIDSPNSLYHLDENHAWSNCHNTPLQLIAEFGVGAAFLLAMFGYWLIRTYRHITTSEQCGILAMLAVIMIHSLVEYPLNFLYFLLPATVLMALASQDAWHMRIQNVPTKISVSVALLFGTVLIIQMQSDYRDIETIHAQESKQSGRLDAEQLVKLAILQQSSLLSNQADELINQLNISLDKPTTWEPLLTVSQRVMKNETAAPHVYRHIFLLSLQGEFQEAEQLLAMAKKVYPISLVNFKEQVSNICATRTDNANINKLMAML